MSSAVLLTLLGIGWLYFFLLPLKWQNRRLAGADPELKRALAAASRGRWEPAAQLLLTAGKDWERRALYTQRLADLAARKGDTWLRSWQTARPGDPDAALVQARARVMYAWRLRGARLARYTSRKRFEDFHQVLMSSREEIAQAAALNPQDPTPLIAEIGTALGLGYPNREMLALWEEITLRAPHHFEAHYVALQYWCVKWHGSKKLAREFAETAASQAPQGSLMAALPLVAWYENNDEEMPPDAYRSPKVRALVDTALADAAAAGDHPRLPEVRHLLAHFLVKQGRYRAAVEQFRSVDGHLDALPWHYWPWKGLCYRAMRTRAARGALMETLRR
ncbi:hypothetical protein OG756_33715 [Streptomyces sp. NBC_01310]|uniref:hypothetical protein n=1 Tax=Streptomyces sp. NBC_01310 TaxID=2903820 RepID=UPI0035B6A5DB|nr:hypothetical protein OG756_33715 [Streptomyces sp. NBC_01310]